MADDVQIQIGATVDKLGNDIDEAKGKIESISSSVDSVSEAGKKLAEIFGIAFTIEGIKSFIESMAELGLQTERTMAMLGMNAQQTVQMGGIAKLTGMDMTGLATSIERMSLNIQRSTRDAFNPAAQALRTLGLNAKDFIGLPASEYIDKLHDAISKFNPSLNLTNAVMAVGGRYVAQLIPLLSLSGKEWEEFKKQVAGAQEGLADAIEGMAGTHQRLTILGESVQSLGARIFTVLKPAIDAVVIAMTNWVQSITAGDIRGAVQTIGDYSLTVLSAVGHMVIQLNQWFATLAKSAEDLKQKTAAAAGGATGGAIGGGLVGGPIGAALGAAGGGALGWLFGGASGGGPADKSKEQLAAFDATIAGWRASLTKFTSTVAEAGGGAAPGGRQDAGAINEGIKQQLDAQAAGIDGSIKLWQGWLKQQEEIFKAAAQAHKMSMGERYAAEIGAVKDEASDELALLEQKKRIWANEPVERKKIEDAIAELAQKTNTKILTLQAEQQKAIEASWESVLKPIESAWNSQLRALLGHTETWAQAMKKIAADLVIQMIEQLEKLAIEQAAIGLAKVTSNSPQGFISGLLGGGQTAAQAANTTAISALTVAVTANTAAVGGNAVASGAKAGADLVGSAGGLASIFSLFKPLLALFGFEKGAWEIPKLDAGSWQIPGGMAAFLHPGEMVVPAGPAAAIRSFAEGQSNAGAGGGGSGGDTHNHYWSAIDGPSVHRFVTQNSDRIAQAVSNSNRRNPSNGWSKS